VQENILLVDDEMPIRHLLGLVLSKEGYCCGEAASSEQAMLKLKEKPVELVILDINLQGKSGLALLPDIKKLWPDTAVLMTTAATEISLAIESMKLGSEDFLTKPFNIDEVALSVKRVLEKRQLQLKIMEYQLRLEEKVEEQTHQMRELFLGSIEALVFALEDKDKYTAGHSRRVTDLAIAVGNHLGLSSGALEDLRWASLLHDVGKIAVDQSILNKPSKLTQIEYEHVMIHAHVGAGIVKPVVNSQIVAIIEHHHDRYDGSGLRQTNCGENIPLGARILFLADAFDAMTSPRPYRPAMSPAQAIDEIRRCSGTQFDPHIAEVFCKIADSENPAKPPSDRQTMESEVK
jgi:response regulator RpfG family c-di-GMP phosphodiesterase